MGDDNRNYEGLFMVDVTQASKQWDTVKDEIEGLVQKQGGSIRRLEKWGERKLAYPVARMMRGAYILSHFAMPPANVTGLRRDIELSEIVRRALIIKEEEEGQVVLEKVEPEIPVATASSEG